MKQIEMEEAPENGKESSHSADANRMNEFAKTVYVRSMMTNIS